MYHRQPTSFDLDIQNRSYIGHGLRVIPVFYQAENSNSSVFWYFPGCVRRRRRSGLLSWSHGAFVLCENKFYQPPNIEGPQALTSLRLLSWAYLA
ncbi:hypothetical protein NXS19_003481 [Fusarium pseudograminearum]|nr:hypothetical protein NXS19_003481 [Fusarium pseudograminearum]